MDGTGRLAGKVALVTGAARGIGYGVAERLCRDGADVILADVLDRVEASAAALAAAGGSASGVHLDVSSEDDVRAGVQAVVAARGGLDILVNNAGVSIKRDGLAIRVETSTTADWDQMLNVNLRGAFLLSRACIAPMRARGGGRIINMVSLAGRYRPEATSAAYAASKAGLIGFSRALAGEVAADAITVNCVAPGAVETEMSAAFSPEQIERVLSRIPLRRRGRVEDVASAVAFLASDEAAYVTGATLDVNGGLAMA